MLFGLESRDRTGIESEEGWVMDNMSSVTALSSILATSIKGIGQSTSSIAGETCQQSKHT